MDGGGREGLIRGGGVGKREEDRERLRRVEEERGKRKVEEDQGKGGEG